MPRSLAELDQPLHLAPATRTFYRVPMLVNAVKMTPRFVIYLIFAVALSLLAFAVAGASFLGLTLALQGWATTPSTTIQVPAAQR